MVPPVEELMALVAVSTLPRVPFDAPHHSGSARIRPDTVPGPVKCCDGSPVTSFPFALKVLPEGIVSTPPLMNWIRQEEELVTLLIIDTEVDTRSVPVEQPVTAASKLGKVAALS